jgi:hypothetical protein
MHLTAQTLTIIGIPLAVIPACIIGFWALYYSLQAANNLKPDSKWPRFGSMARSSIDIVPRSEFTELGLWYRRRAFILAFVFVAWGFVIVSFWTFAVSYARSELVELSVDRAISTRDLGGDAAIELFLTPESGRKYAAFTSKAVGRLAEFRFLNQTLAISRLRTPFLSGHFQISLPPNRIDRAFGENSADEIASKLSSNNAKLEVRVFDQEK